MMGQTFAQIVAVMRLEMKKTFLARRGLWVYFLAFAPVFLFLAHSLHAPYEQRRLERVAAANPVSPQALDRISVGLSRDEVVERLGQPYRQRSWRRRGQDGQRRPFARYDYTDGRRSVTFHFSDGKLTEIAQEVIDTLPISQLIFATSFQFYFLRLAIFFGCVGIFVNLFRGEMLDKSLHFYLLTPLRRETLLIGKYLAGLLATVVIFTSSTALQWLAMLWQFDGSTITRFLEGPGWGQVGAYLGVTALACVGYGSVFLVVGLLFRNPIVPVAVVLLLESANPFLPPALKKISMIFYLQSICPVPAMPDRNMPPMISLLIAPTEPASVVTSLICIALLTGLVLMAAAYLARRLEINYSTD